MILSTCRKLRCLSACQKQTSSFTSFLRYYILKSPATWLANSTLTHNLRTWILPDIGLLYCGHHKWVRKASSRGNWVVNQEPKMTEMLLRSQVFFFKFCKIFKNVFYRIPMGDCFFHIQSRIHRSQAFYRMVVLENSTKLKEIQLQWRYRKTPA